MGYLIKKLANWTLIYFGLALVGWVLAYSQPIQGFLYIALIATGLDLLGYLYYVVRIYWPAKRSGQLNLTRFHTVVMNHWFRRQSSGYLFELRNRRDQFEHQLKTLTMEEYVRTTPAFNNLCFTCAVIWNESKIYTIKRFFLDIITPLWYPFTLI